jgi:hypothetical protein
MINLHNPLSNVCIIIMGRCGIGLLCLNVIELDAFLFT